MTQKNQLEADTYSITWVLCFDPWWDTVTCFWGWKKRIDWFQKVRLCRVPIQFLFLEGIRIAWSNYLIFKCGEGSIKEPIWIFLCFFHSAWTSSCGSVQSNSSSHAGVTSGEWQQVPQELRMQWNAGLGSGMMWDNRDRRDFLHWEPPCGSFLWSNCHKLDLRSYLLLSPVHAENHALSLCTVMYPIFSFPSVVVHNWFKELRTLTIQRKYTQNML